MVAPPPSQGICPSSASLLDNYFAGFTCYENLGDSNLGTTEAECVADGGAWLPYNCETADSHYQAAGGTSWEWGDLFQGLWSVQCCRDSPLLTETVDIGPVGIPGGTTFSSDTNTVGLYASGIDIWGTSDSFRFAYQALKGDGSIWARVYKPTITDAWVKSGLMIRSDLSPQSQNAGMFYTGFQGVIAHARLFPGTETTYNNAEWFNREGPVWMAMTRSGDNFEFFTSEDGANYNKFGATMTVPMGETVYIGLAATAHNNGAMVFAPSDSFGFDEL